MLLLASHREAEALAEMPLSAAHHPDRGGDIAQRRVRTEPLRKAVAAGAE